jgi:urease accessory protein
MTTPAESPPRLLELMQLADSALPTGGYAFSGGLEAAARLGLLRDADGLRRYFLDYLEQFASGELPCLNAAWTAPGGDALRHPVEELDALLAVPESNRASATQGRGWLSILRLLAPESGIDALAAWFAEQDLPTHFLACAGAGLRRAGWPLGQVRRLCYYLSARDQTSAAVRLGLIGPMDGQRLLAAGVAAGERILMETEGLMPADARRGSPLLDIAQARHATLYTRLFQS